MLFNVVCFLHLGVAGCVVMWCIGCVSCCDCCLLSMMSVVGSVILVSDMCVRRVDVGCWCQMARVSFPNCSRCIVS